MMSLIVLPALIPGEGKSISAMTDNFSSGNYTNNGMGGWCSSAMDGKSCHKGYTNIDTCNLRVPHQ